MIQLNANPQKIENVVLVLAYFCAATDYKKKRKKLGTFHMAKTRRRATLTNKNQLQSACVIMHMIERGIERHFKKQIYICI